jgi:hypothetical protein
VGEITIRQPHAAIRGDGDRAIQIHEQRLTGQYSYVVQGWALALDVGAASWVGGQQSAMFRATDAVVATSPLARFGNWLGDQIYDYVSLVEAARDPRLLRARYLP